MSFRARSRAASVEGAKERIHYYMDWIRLLWATILLNGSGIIGLVSTLDSRAKLIAFTAGVRLEGAFVTLLFLAHRRADALLQTGGKLMTTYEIIGVASVLLTFVMVDGVAWLVVRSMK